MTVVTRAYLEDAPAPDALNRLLGEDGEDEDDAEWQCERTLPFSSVVDLMGMVVCKVQPSMKTAYQAVDDTLPVSLTAVYDKLNGIEGDMGAALVRHTAARLAPAIEAMGSGLPPSFPGFRGRMLDGNYLAATERRISVLRKSRAGPLLGHALVIIDPALVLAIDMILRVARRAD